MNSPTPEQVKKPYYGYIQNPLINSLELSVRASNVLRNSGLVQTIEDFMALTKPQVMALKGAGIRTWREIRELQKNLRDGHPEVNAMLTAQETPKDTSALRDFFAMHAPVTWDDVYLQMGWSNRARSSPLDDSERRALWAVMALLRYEYADAMLIERKDSDDD